MTHIAIQESLDGKNVDRLEKVTDEQYPQIISGNCGATQRFFKIRPRCFRPCLHWGGAPNRECRKHGAADPCNRLAGFAHRKDRKRPVWPPVMMKLSPTPRSRHPRRRIVTETAGEAHRRQRQHINAAPL
jgi:hypothetical protein